MCQTAYLVRSHVLRMSLSVLCIFVTTFDAESEFVNCDVKAPRFPERTKWIFTRLVYRTFCRCDASSLLNIRAKKVRTSTLLSYVCQGQIRAEKQMKFFFVNFFFLFLWKSVWMLTVVNSQEDGCRWTCLLHVEMWNPGDDKLMPRNSFLFAIHGFGLEDSIRNPIIHQLSWNRIQIATEHVFVAVEIFFLHHSNKLNISGSSQQQKVVWS